MLLAGSGFDGRDNLALYAQLGKGAERGLLIRLIIADGLVKADHPLLHQILPVRADEEVWPRFHANYVFIPFVKRFVRPRIPRVGTRDERFVRHAQIIDFFAHVVSSVSKRGGLRRPTVLHFFAAALS